MDTHPISYFDTAKRKRHPLRHNILHCPPLIVNLSNSPVNIWNRVHQISVHLSIPSRHHLI